MGYVAPCLPRPALAASRSSLLDHSSVLARATSTQQRRCLHATSQPRGAAAALPTLAHRRTPICRYRYLPPAGHTTDGTTRRREMQDIQHKAALRLAVHPFSPRADCARPFCHHWASDCQGRIGDYLTSARRHSYFRLWHQPSVRIGAVIAVDIGSALNQPLRRGPFLAHGAEQRLSRPA